MGKASKSRRAQRKAVRQFAQSNGPPMPENSVPVKAAVSAAPVAVAPKGEIGVSGTNNWVGRLNTEANAKLAWQLAYGTPGSFQWGEWEKLERTDHMVSAALAMISAPLRDANVEIQAPEVEEDDAPAESDPKQLADPALPVNPADLVPKPVGKQPAQVDPEKQKIADFVRDNFECWLEPRWPTLLEQIVKYGLGYGFSIHEIIWDVRPDDRVPGGQAFYVKKLAQRLPSSVKQDGWHEENGDLAYITQSGVRDGKWVEGVKLPADKIVLATWNRSGNNYAGFSAFRPVWYIGQMRADLLKIMAVGHSREALGVPVAMIDKEAPDLSEAQRDDLQTLLENVVYHENAGFQLPKGVTLEWFFSPGANKGNVLDTWKGLGLAILETVQAQQMFLGTGSTGSRAVGKTHDDTKNQFIEGIRGWIEGIFNGVGSQAYTGLVKKLVDLNFGPQDEYPELKLVTKKDALDPLEFAQSVVALAGAGLYTATDSDEDAIRERFGLPDVDPEERAQAKADKLAAAQTALQTAQAQSKGEGNKPPQSLAEILGLGE